MYNEISYIKPKCHEYSKLVTSLLLQYIFVTSMLMVTYVYFTCKRKYCVMLCYYVSLPDSL